MLTGLGNRFVYIRVHADRAEKHTLIGCICADGTWIPPFVILKGVRWNDKPFRGKSYKLKDTLVTKRLYNFRVVFGMVSIFIHGIPPDRPVVIFMDSHSSHIAPEVIELAREQHIFVLTFPSHTSHLLQPLDVGVYHALKCNWSKQPNSCMKKHQHKKPNRVNFYEHFNPAFIETFIAQTIQKSFKKSGIMPLNNSSISIETQAPSKLTEKQSLGEILP
ncbi:hypothetical protein PR048_024683 [Dryococelus australis]|uniref:DDE-1 domain-containing protein n=1 Tax=Dryococelus australis TaxID=614101 RepID=A0ABQ9GPB8_9NEOP|nr:hypothetical protein PR048_024683 [Dryococelus australis]